MEPDAVSVKPQVQVSTKPTESSCINTDSIEHLRTRGTQCLLPGRHNTNDIETENSGYLKSVEHVLKHITGVLALESVVTHQELGYTGTLDCIANYRLDALYIMVMLMLCSKEE